MDDLEKCLAFFAECLLFKAKYKDFEKVCQNMDIDKMDKHALKEAAEYYVFVKKEMSRICHFKMAEHDNGLFGSDDEMEVDSDDDTDSDTDMDSDSNSDDTDTDMDTDNDSGDETGDDTDTDDSMSTDGEDNDDDASVLLESDDCCWDKVLQPFFNEVEHNNSAFSAIQKEEDRIEDELVRMKSWFSSDEKPLCAKLITEICLRFDEEGYKFIKRCPSLYIKMLVAYCKDIDEDGVLEKMFGVNSDLIMDENVTLNSKRKVLKDKENITKLVNYIKENTLPMVKEFIQMKQKRYLDKCNQEPIEEKD